MTLAPSPPHELHAAVARFVEDAVLPLVAEWDREDVLPGGVLDELRALRLPGALVPAEFGGPGLGVAQLAPTWRALSRGWISLTGAINPTGLATTLLVRHGTRAQQERWLPRFASGEAMASFSITEPQAGSDLKQLETSAARRPQGGWRLDGEKRWVAGGHSSALVCAMVLAEGADRPSCLLLPGEGRGSARWAVEALDKTGYRGVESAAYRFDGFEAERAELLGGDEDGLGLGARQMLDALDVGRVNVACRALGVVDRCLAVALGEATSREVGGEVLGDHTHAQLRIGELRARLDVCAAAVDAAARAIDAGSEDAGRLATGAKVVASDTAVWAVDAAARLAASRSYAADDELARLRRDAPQTQIGEGANDALLLALAKQELAGSVTR